MSLAATFIVIANAKSRSRRVLVMNAWRDVCESQQ